jgi:hypothetical protein
VVFRPLGFTAFPEPGPGPRSGLPSLRVPAFQPPLFTPTASAASTLFLCHTGGGREHRFSLGISRMPVVSQKPRKDGAAERQPLFVRNYLYEIRELSVRDPRAILTRSLSYPYETRELFIQDSNVLYLRFVSIPSGACILCKISDIYKYDAPGNLSRTRSHH